MTTRFMTDPHAMRDMAGRFEMHAQTVEDEARRMWASSQNIAGAGWSGMASATSLDTMGQMNTAFRNIVNMLHGVRDGLVRDANNYELDTMGQMNTAFRNIVNMLHGVRDGLVRDANNYEQQEQASQQILSS
ncbi:putative ESAT-6-like protein 7 [Mycobacterium marinum]|uniref:Putative ESAT-6-like protein 7 n=1 Tax=Mycobacterium marinum TaxID=1781 RepID=A0A3E2N2T8_MYCMR|nr:WXG100 family type VII secretion target [Mycobacterium marinum]RFZ47707.1 putative ESAT-6-like protein 7 [Mycobacterium marinum]